MAKKTLLLDKNNNAVLPITRGELVLDSSGNPALRSNEFLATASQPGLMSAEDKYKIANMLASAVANALTLKINNGSIEGTNLYTFNGSAAKTLNIVAGDNITLTPSAGAVSISASIPTTIDAYTKTESDNRYLKLIGGVMTGEIQFNISELGTLNDISSGIIAGFKVNRTQINDLIVNSITLGSSAGGTSSDLPLIIRKYGRVSSKAPVDFTNLVTINPSGNITTIGNITASGGFIGNLDGQYINALTNYAKATTIAAIATTDSLNTALGKLELKADTAYTLVAGAYDGDGTIENLAEILKVLEGISDTETIQAIVGKYLPLSGGNMNNAAVITFTANGTLRQTTATTSNATSIVEWYKGTTKDSNYKHAAQIGWHNTGNTDGAIYLVPYPTDTDPWASSVGLYIGKTALKWNNQGIIHSGNIGSQSVNYANSAGSATTSTSATSASYSRNLLGRNTSGTDYSATDGNLIFAEWNTHSDNRWYLKAKGYETRVGYASNSDKLDGIDSTGFLRQVVVANNTTNDFNTFGNMTLTGRVDPTTGASLVNAPWSGGGPAGGYGTLTYLFNGSGYGTQMAWGYSSNRIYIRNRYWGGSGVGAIWRTTWDSLALTSDLKNPTDYYWANVQISDTSSTTTNPTFATATAGTVIANYLDLRGATNATMTYASTNPCIVFSENGGQCVKLLYTDYDSYRSPAGLKVIGDQGGEWFEVVGTIYGGGFYHNNYGSNAYVLTAGGGAAKIADLSVNYANSAGNADTVDSLHASRFAWIYNSSEILGSSADKYTCDAMAADGNSNAHMGMIYPKASNPTGKNQWVHVWSQSWTRGSIASWCSQIALGVEAGTGMWYRTTSGALSSKGWTRVIDDSNWYSYIGTSGYVMREYVIDASGLNSNTWYPVTMYLGAHHNVRIECRVALNSGTKPSWSTHGSGFSVRKIWETNGSGWGTNPVSRRVLVSNYAFTDTDPVRGLGQLTNGSVEYVYVRGGGKYYFYLSHNITPTLQTSDYTTSSQTVSVTTTAPSSISVDVGATSTVYVGNSDHNSTYRMVWHSGNTLYGTGGIYCNPSTDYLYAASMNASDWFRSSGDTGWYNPTNNCHVYPNATTTYGGLMLRGEKGGYTGFILGSSTNYMNLMDNGTDKGLYQEGKLWILYYNRSSNYVGIRTSSLSDPLTVAGITRVVANGKYLRIGPQNSSHTHYETDATVSHWFNKTVHVDGNIEPYGNNQHSAGSTSYRFSNVYSYAGDFAGSVTITYNSYPGLTIHNNTTSGEASMYIKNNTAGWALGVNTWGVGAGQFAIGQYLGTGSSNWRFKIDNNGYCYTSSYLNLGGGHEKNASSPTYVWGSNSSDNYLRSYQTGSLSVNYANSAGYTTRLYANSTANLITSPGSYSLAYSRFQAGASNIFPVSNNANGCITAHLHSGNYFAQIGLSSDGRMYYRTMMDQALDAGVAWNKVAWTSEIPSVGNGTVTITQNGTTKGSFTMNQSGNTTIALTDNNTNTTYSAGTGLSLSSTTFSLASRSATTSTMYIVGCTSSTSALYTGTQSSNGVRILSGTLVYAYGGFYESSDERLKHILNPIKVDLDELSKLRKIYYLWKENSDESLQLGVIAQDVQKLYPELVGEDEFGLLSVAYDKLSVIALEAIDTLYQEHKQLKKRVDELEKLLTNRGIL